MAVRTSRHFANMVASCEFVPPIFPDKLFQSSMFFFGRKTRQREQWLAKEFPREWTILLRERMWQYNHLRGDLLRRVEDVVRVMVHERRWTGGSGFAVTDEMRVTISANAALMTLGLEEPYYFDKLDDIIIYPKPFFVTAEQSTSWSTDPVFGGEVNSPRLGEAWHRGPVLLAWSSILHPEKSNHTNVVLHELAHHLDGLDGDVSGVPPMSDSRAERDWYRVTEAHFLELVGRVRRNEATLLDRYGATDRVEFFAVATECFFERPHDLREHHPQLFEILANYFRHDPTSWLPREGPWSEIRGLHKSTPGQGGRKSRRRGRPPRSDQFDDPFTEGVELAREGWLEEAVDAFTRSLARDGDDAEAYAERAHVFVELDLGQQALADAERALQLDPGDPGAVVARGCAYVLLGRYREGASDLAAASDRHETATGRMLYGYALYELGELRGAIDQLSLAITLDPYEAEAYRFRAEILDQLGKGAEAARDRERAERLEPPGE